MGRKNRTLEGFRRPALRKIWVTEEEEWGWEEARLSFSPQMGIAGLEGNAYLCRKFLNQ